jgi:hypothetical protein
MGVPRNSPCPCGSGKKYKNCGFQKDFIEVPAERKAVKFTMPGQENITKQVTNMDSIPTHNKNGLKPNITKDQMINLCIDEIYKILQNEKVEMLADLVNRIVHDMDIVPIFTYREIGEQIEKNKRFAIHMMQICSLSGTDPLKLMVDKLS